MRHVVVLAHPNPQSFNATAARAWIGALGSMGHATELRDLYAMDFEPRLKAAEIPWAKAFSPAPDIVAERALIASADAITFVYPLWFNAPPAILKGYIERVFGLGFAYGQAAPGTRPLLGGKLMVSITSSGAPDTWAQSTGAIERLKVGFDEHLAAVCGLTVLEHLHFGGVTPGIRSDAVEDMLAEITHLASRLFPPQRGRKEA